MENSNYKLALEPTESRVAQNESDFYTFRMPLGVMTENDPNVLQTILDTAGVAFGHNSPESKVVTITCPEGSTDKLMWLIIALEAKGLQIELREQLGSRFVDFNVIKNTDLCCVDRRLDDAGFHPVSKIAQITHAGGALVLHPLLQDEMPAHHGEALKKSIRFASENGAPVHELNYHFGAEGGKGCGMYGILSGASQKIKETLQTPDDVVTMLNMVREAYARILSTDCRITCSVVYGNDDSMIYDPDNRADLEALKAEKGLVL